MLLQVFLPFYNEDIDSNFSFPFLYIFPHIHYACEYYNLYTERECYLLVPSILNIEAVLIFHTSFHFSLIDIVSRSIYIYSLIIRYPFYFIFSILFVFQFYYVIYFVLLFLIVLFVDMMLPYSLDEEFWCNVGFFEIDALII